jgi:hypothetical protein
MTDYISPLVQPLILEIFLYQNNYKDRILVSELRKRTNLIQNGDDENSFFVKADDLFNVITSKFAKDLDMFRNSNDKTIFKNATSIYFLDTLLEKFHSLKYFKINVSKSENFSRENDHLITFDYRIAHSRIDLSSEFDSTDLFLMECIFRDIKIFEYDPIHPKNYIDIHAHDLIDRISIYSANLNEESEEFNIIHRIMMIIGTKLEKDNSALLLIVKK